ncbi:MAG TPA: hypothetical protein VMU32_11835 [Solirubrobacteraceae bacterium]|nr:hypothetical protein [Solirubrobacteraceae bacterium]
MRSRLSVAAALAVTCAIALTASAPGTASTPAPRHRVEAAEFFVRYAHGRVVTCAMYDGRAGVQTLCETERPGYEQKATLGPAGTVRGCSRHARALTNACDLGNAGEGTPTYRPGKLVTVGRFRCRVLAGGVRCTLARTGRGFLFTPTKVLAVGGATIRWAAVSAG